MCKLSNFPDKGHYKNCWQKKRDKEGKKGQNEKQEGKKDISFIFFGFVKDPRGRLFIR